MVGAWAFAFGPSAEIWKILFFTEIVFFTILNGKWEVWGCPGGGGGPYEEIPSNFGRVWSYRTWGKSIFMFFGNIGNSLHHQIPPNWSSGLQIGHRIFIKARVASQELSNISFFQTNDQNDTNMFRTNAIVSVFLQMIPRQRKSVMLLRPLEIMETTKIIEVVHGTC